MYMNGVLHDIFPKESDIPTEYQLADIHQTEYLINGEIRHWKGPMQEVRSPIFIRTGNGLEQKRLGSYPLMGEKEAMEALRAAVEAYSNGRGKWPAMSVADRIDHVKEFVGRMKKQRQEMVKLLMWEIGKSRHHSETEFDRTIAYINDTIEAVKELDRLSSRFTSEEGVIGQIKRAPLGVVLCMGPYNYPLNETFTTMIPALIMGNPVIFKPPRFGVLVHRPLLEIFRDCFPPGVVNTVYGKGEVVAKPLMTSGGISVLAFIGSSKVAGMLKKLHPQPHRLRSCLGLEAKNPAIILADADLDVAVKECLLGALSFNGQRCTALKMFFVHYKIADEFMERFVTAVSNMKIGMPWEDKVEITPMPEMDRISYLDGLVKDALQKGAQVVNEGGGASCQTLFYPAILAPVNNEMRVYHEEQFGPVIPIAAFADIETPVRYIMESKYGQQASVFGKDPDKIGELIDLLVNQVCRVNINCQCQRGPDNFPFTGRKDSAELTLSVTDALRVFSIRTMVAAKNTDLNKNLFAEITREHKSKFLTTDYLF
ncbi:MAG: NADP-dependent glyceraldehyde-3-phosphate dehydrogenase [Syntrophomonadaceae bacterium]|nr:NADP-dependent glyceraldehyde-3-phosphate dehydrogenase [Syntrophomonadaceae bacterium]